MTRSQPADTPVTPTLADLPAWTSTPINDAIAAAEKAGTCPRCGRDTGDASCRPVRGSWFCMADGLIGLQVIDRDRTNDRTPAQQQTHDAYAPLLTEAGHRVDTAMETHAAAQQAHYQALARLQLLGGATPEGGRVLARPHGAGPVQGERPRQDATWATNITDAKADVEDTGHILDTAEAELTRARVAYHGLAARRDAAVTRAGVTGNPGKPRAATILGRIRDRVMSGT